jgi:microsomal dipeptidase-like Zn-dependent dipeptidase
MDHFRKVMGIDHIAIGSDFGGIITGMVKGLDAIDRMPLLWQELEQRGYSFEMIEKIAWKNAARVLHDIL